MLYFILFIRGKNCTVFLSSYDYNYTSSILNSFLKEKKKMPHMLHVLTSSQLW